MRMTNKHWKILALAAVVSVFAGCTSDSLDDGDSPDVVLTVSVENNPTVTAQAQGTGGTCVFQVTEWTVGFTNTPKNSYATSPFSDVIIEGVLASYTWTNGATSPDRFLGTLNVAVPVDGVNTASFYPILFEDIPADGVSASVTLTFYARTVEGTSFQETAYSTLLIDSCVQSGN